MADQYHDHMTIRVTATDAKARILALLDQVAAGQEVEITKRGTVVARLVPAGGAHGLRGRFADVATAAEEADELFSTGAVWDLP
jgi:prevent-host-death family protein